MTISASTATYDVMSRAKARRPPGHKPKSRVRARAKSAAGYVYVLTNPAMPGIVKIGSTGRTPKARARELSSTTGVALPFKVAFCVKVRDAVGVERAAHEALKRHRVNRRREFFSVSSGRARQIIVRCADRDKFARATFTKVLVLIGVIFLVFCAISGNLLQSLDFNDLPEWIGRISSYVNLRN